MNPIDLFVIRNSADYQVGNKKNTNFFIKRICADGFWQTNQIRVHPPDPFNPCSLFVAVLILNRQSSIVNKKGPPDGEPCAYTLFEIIKDQK